MLIFSSQFKHFGTIGTVLYKKKCKLLVSILFVTEELFDVCMLCDIYQIHAELSFFHTCNCFCPRFVMIC